MGNAFQHPEKEEKLVDSRKLDIESSTRKVYRGEAKTAGSKRMTDQILTGEPTGFMAQAPQVEITKNNR